ncbi:MAG: phospholipid carrier-dependent glycosyltransferase, partial [Pseudomonadota bacterium]
SVRIPTAIFALSLCLLTFALGNMLYGRLAGWLGAAVIATSLYMFTLSRIVLLDVPVSVFIVATLTCFLYAVKNQDGNKRNFIIYLMYVAAACAVLSKGLIGAVLPAVVIFIWLAATNNWKILANIKIFNGTLLFLAISVPWHIMVSLKNPEFAQFYFIHEHFERYLTKAHGRYQPFWFFGVVLLAGFFPWISFLFQAVATNLKNCWSNRNIDSAPLFLAIWVGFILFFFSLSDSKLIPYILPIFPPLAAMLGNYFAGAWQEKSTKLFGLGFLIMVLALFAMSLAPTFLPQILDPESKAIVAIKKGGDDVSNFAIIAVIAAVALLIAYVQGQKKHVIGVMLIVAAAILQFGDSVASHYNKDSMQQLAGTILSARNELKLKNDEVVLYGEYYQDLPVYLQQKVTLVSWEKTELSFGAKHEDTSAWLINDGEFWKRWIFGDKFMFAIMREDAYLPLIKNKKPEDLHLYKISQEGRNILFINVSPEKLKKEQSQNEHK